MTTWSQRVGQAVKMGLIWAAAWFGVGMLILVTAVLLTGESGADVPYPLGVGMLGFFAGAAFSGVLGIVRGERELHQMPLPKVTVWGGLSGLLFSVAFVGVVALAGDGLLDMVGVGGVFSLVSAATAAVSLGLARWGQARHASHAGSRGG